jgi:predicted DNA-binding WGR domain protein
MGKSIGKQISLEALSIIKHWRSTVRLMRNWGRIGTNGQELAEIFASEVEALEALARAKRRRGYRDL